MGKLGVAGLSYRYPRVKSGGETREEGTSTSTREKAGRSEGYDETPHTVQTHGRSTLYIYKVFEHLLQWLVVIQMQFQPNICSYGT